MSNRVFLRRTAMLMVAASCFAAGAGHAAEKALFKFKYSSFGAAALVGGVSITIPRFTVTPTDAVATVGTGPSASVMWPSRVLSEMSIMYAGGTITPNGMENPSPYGLYFSFVQAESNYNRPATLSKSGGVSANTTFGWPATTTICSNTCLPRDGTGFQTVSTNRYGGTAKLIDWGVSTGLKKNFVLGGFTQQSFNIQETSMLLAPAFPGQYGQGGVVAITTPNSGTYSSPVHFLLGRYSTGTARARLTINAYTTDATKMGTNNLNTANLTGTISLVKPFIQTSWKKIGGTVVGLGGGNKFAAINMLDVTFLPEPSKLTMLGAGFLALGALYWRRSV